MHYQYIRVDGSAFRPLTKQEIEPYVYEAMTHYFRLISDLYPENSILSPLEATENSLNEHSIVLINGEYLFGYSVGSEWYSKEEIMVEEFLIRIREGNTSLEEVIEVIQFLCRLEGTPYCLVGTRAATNQQAIKKLYSKSGLQELITMFKVEVT